MEVFKENVVFSSNSLNLKNKTPLKFGAVKKTALADVRNTLHLKNVVESPSILSKQKNVVETPGTRSEQKVQTDMNELLFFSNCYCSEAVAEQDWYTIPEDLRLTKEEIDIITTRWGDRKGTPVLDQLSSSYTNLIEDLSEEVTVSEPAVSFLEFDGLDEDDECVKIDDDFLKKPEAYSQILSDRFGPDSK